MSPPSHIRTTVWSLGQNGPKHWCRLGSCPLDVVFWKALLQLLEIWQLMRELQNPMKRPPVPRSPMAPDLLTREPDAPIVLEQDLFLENLKCARRGAAGGPSGLTSEHLRPILMCPTDSQKFWKMGQELARARVPDEIVRAIRMGRLTALQKKSGGVRGLVAGDIVRRLVARTVAQQLESAVKIATAPFQFALSTRAGSECVVLQTLTDVDPSATILSVDGIGAIVLVSREAMLRGVLTVEERESACHL